MIIIANRFYPLEYKKNEKSTWTYFIRLRTILNRKKLKKHFHQFFVYGVLYVINCCQQFIDLIGFGSFLNNKSLTYKLDSIRVQLYIT